MAETQRTKALQQLASKFPAANQQVAKGQQAARQMQLQQSIAGAPRGAGARQAQQAGAQQAGQAGAIDLQAAQQTQSDLTQVGQLGLQERGRQLREQQFGQDLGLRKEAASHQDRLAALGEDIKTTVLDNRLEFQKDNLNRNYLNERKLADIAKLNSASDIAFKEKAQLAQQAHQRKLQTMEMAHKQITRALNQDYIKGEQALNQEQQKYLARLQSDMEAKIARQKAEARNKAGMWSAIGTVGGAVAGGIIGGGPGGAAVGAAAGGGAGQSIGAMLE